MRRRDLVKVIAGTAAAWPFTARAQQPAMPVIGFLSGGAPVAHLMTAFRQGMVETGFVEGRNVLIDYRSAEGQYDRLPALAAELAHRPAAVIVAITTPPALAAKAATSTIPIVFSVPDDPVKHGLVMSLARPGGNATGMYFFFSDLGTKLLGLLHELIPKAERIGLMVNPQNANAEAVTRDVTTAASAMGIKLNVLEASDNSGIDTAFAALVHGHADALVVGPDPFFFRRRLQIVTLATRHAIPTICNAREYAEAGGLMTYGTSLADSFRQVGTYTGRILSGEKPADLPVVQSTRFEFVINLLTARALDLEVPPTLLARADEVIE